MSHIHKLLPPHTSCTCVHPNLYIYFYSIPYPLLTLYHNVDWFYVCYDSLCILYTTCSIRVCVCVCVQKGFANMLKSSVN